MAAGADPSEDLIFADTVKDPKQIAYAHASGWTISPSTTPRRSPRSPGTRPGAKVHLRLAVSNEGSVAHLSEKFGAEPAEAVPLLLAARDQGLRPRGVSFHVGSQCLDVQRYVEALDQVATVFDGARRRGHRPGDGRHRRRLPRPLPRRGDRHRRPCAGRSTTTTASSSATEVKLVAEPGRAIVGRRRDPGDQGHLRVGARRPQLALLRRRHLRQLPGSAALPDELPHADQHRRARCATYVLAGPTCDSIDVFSRDAQGEICTVDLPEMHLDDLLIAGSMGAYTFSESTRFNGFEPPKFVYID